MSYTRASAAKMIAIIESYADARLAAVTAERDAAKRRIETLDEALRNCISAFHVTLMVINERETDADKRYDFALRHPEIKSARAALEGKTP